MTGPFDFARDKVLVVGGTSGIGNAIAAAFRDHGARVCVTGTRQDAETYAQDGTDFDGMDYRQLDVSDPTSIERLEMPFDGLSVLINSQGLTGSTDVDPLDADQFDRVMAVNLTSVAQLCRRFRDDLSASKGSVINIGSGACFVAVPHRPAYSASKGGLMSLTRSLAAAWARDGVRVNGIAPGYVPTRMTAATDENSDRHRKSLERIPMGRWGNPAEMAGVALFLASPLASYVTGQMIAVDGGMTL
ncbi:MAG: SDR family oxidoreductase [Novosphingobium sp.]|nr:SDR family oxidoreductase [Novosphingobium sp.]